MIILVNSFTGKHTTQEIQSELSVNIHLNLRLCHTVQMSITES